MKIAVTYDSQTGEVFQHFGRTETFKVYEVVDGVILDTEIIGNEGVGHEALAFLLASKDVVLLICGGMGEGAQAALKEAGIVVYAGATGDADAAVQSFLNGTLEQGGVNCDHHDHEHHHHGEAAAEAEGGCNCGDDCGDDCGSGCGGCGGGCHEIQIIYDGKNAGKTVRVHYRGTLNDGTQFDASYDRGEPLTFVSGAGQMIAGFDKAVVDMNVGDEVDIHLMPEEAYGEVDPNAILEIAIKDLPGSEELQVGEVAYLQDPYGRPIPVICTNKTEDMITLDANHELAGKELNFHLELVEVVE